jgi:hypothetical protein
VLDLSKEPRFRHRPVPKSAKELADLMAPAGAGGSILHLSTVGQEDTHPWYNCRRYRLQLQGFSRLHHSPTGVRSAEHFEMVPRLARGLARGNRQRMRAN